MEGRGGAVVEDEEIGRGAGVQRAEGPRKQRRSEAVAAGQEAQGCLHRVVAAGLAQLQEGHAGFRQHVPVHPVRAQRRLEEGLGRGVADVVVHVRPGVVDEPGAPGLGVLELGRLEVNAVGEERGRTDETVPLEPLDEAKVVAPPAVLHVGTVFGHMDV